MDSMCLVASLFHWSARKPQSSSAAFFPDCAKDQSAPNLLSESYLKLETFGQYRIAGSCTVMCSSIDYPLIEDLEAAFGDHAAHYRGKVSTVTDIHRHEEITPRCLRPGDIILFIDRYSQKATRRYLITPCKDKFQLINTQALTECMERRDYAPMVMSG